MITAATKLNAVIGYPLAHSQSPRLHNALYQKLNIDAVMLAFGRRDVRKLISAVHTANIGLTAVTMPFKQSVMPLLDKLDTSAQAAGAVNTIINKAGRLHGYNTDVDGVAYAMRDVALRGRTVLIIGAGGAARAVASYAYSQGAKLLYYNRTRSHALQLRQQFGGTMADIYRLDNQQIDVVVNATPLGMHPHTARSPLPRGFQLRRGQNVFDVIYNPLETKLLRAASVCGAHPVSGVDMFIGQALRQVELYTGKRLTSKPLRQFARRIITKNL